jgi:hypothetical protein
MDDQELNELSIKARYRLATNDGVRFVLEQLAAMNEKAPASLDLAITQVQARAALEAKAEFVVEEQAVAPDEAWQLLAELAIADANDGGEMFRLILRARVLLRGGVSV